MKKSYFFIWTMLVMLGLFMTLPSYAQSMLVTSTGNLNRCDSNLYITAQQPCVKYYINCNVNGLGEVHHVSMNICHPRYSASNQGKSVRGLAFAYNGMSTDTKYTNTDTFGNVRVTMTKVNNGLIEVTVFMSSIPPQDGQLHVEVSSGTKKQIQNFNICLDPSLVTIVDPILVLDNKVTPGTTKAMVSSAVSIEGYTLYDITTSTKTTVASKYLSPTANSFELTLPQSDCKRRYEVVMSAHTDDWNFQMTKQFYGRPFHTIDHMCSYQNNRTDSLGNHPVNVVAWRITNPKDTDVMGFDDVFVIERAKKSDFSDAVAITTHSFTPDSISLNDGYYYYEDKSEDFQYNELSSDKKDQIIYYRVYRAVAQSQWSGAEKFCRKDKLPLAQSLPNISRISLSKGDNFDNDKKVTIRVELDNPILKDVPSSYEAYIGFSAGTYTKIFMSNYNEPLDHRPVTFNTNGGYTSGGQNYYKVDWHRSIGSVGDHLEWDASGVTDWDLMSIGNNRMRFYQDGTNNILGVNSKMQLVVEPKDNANNSRSWNMVLITNINYALIRHLWGSNRKEALHRNDRYRHPNIYAYQWDEKAQVVIHRVGYTKETRPTQEAQQDLIIKGSDVKWDAKKGCYYAEITDVQSMPYLLYYYTAKVVEADSHFPLLMQDSVRTTREEAESCYSTSANSIRSMSATLGTEDRRIVVKWEVDDAANPIISLSRCIPDFSKPNPYAWTPITLSSQEVREYVDEKAMSGTGYAYRLQSTVNYFGKEYTNEKIVYGWCPYYGSISGQVQMENGCALPGGAKVVIDIPNVNIPEFRDENGKLLMPGKTQFARKDTLTTHEEKGYFDLDSVVFHNSGSNYKVTVVYGDLSILNPTGVSGAYTLTMDPARHFYTDLTFTTKDVRRFSGRVLYEMSTIPVAGAHFCMNGDTLCTATGEYVSTDNMGEFSFVVPRVMMTLQVCKKGHTYDQGGYFRNKKDSTRFVPDQNYDNVIMTDLTKVQLIGRIVAGDRMAQKPIGKGLTSNRLGDDMRIELKLEGNNTSWILYNSKDPDQTIRKDSACLTREGSANKYDYTNYSFEKRRIQIYPRDTTGEFVVNLPPARYKITAMSAKGYSTFFSADEGFEVLDLQDSVGTAHYQRIYHAPVNVTYTPYYYGLTPHYFGEQVLKNINTYGIECTDTIARYDRALASTSYLFGYPVFTSGKTYTIKVTAHEDYYYNNDRTTHPYEVNLNKGKLIVRNELESGYDEQNVDLDAMGTAIVQLKVNNPTFTQTGKEALRSVNMQVMLNNYYYDAKPLRGFVAGTQRREQDVLNIGKQVSVLDVLRDPPGSGSFVTREAGTTYQWSYSYLLKTVPTLSIVTEVGTQNKNTVGTPFFSVINEFGATVSIPFSIAFTNSYDTQEGEYTMTLTDRVSTSSGSFDQGAIADVYIGVLTDYSLSSNDHICVIDSAAYAGAAAAFKDGTCKLLSEGTDAKGNKQYLVVGTQYAVGPSHIADFFYTQKHILTIIIPNLEKKSNALVQVVNTLDAAAKATWQQRADASNQCQYVRLATDTVVQWFVPKGMQNAVNVVDSCKQAIRQWQSIIAKNEEAKVKALSQKPYKSYSIGQTTITHEEKASSYSSTLLYNTPPSVSIGLGGGKGSSSSKETKENETNVSVAGIKCSFNLSVKADITTDETKKYIRTTSAGYGYTLSTADQSYLDVDVYGTTSSAVTMPTVVSSNTVNNTADAYSKDTARLHSYIFFQRAGAMRNPWLAPDSTLFYKKGTPLATPILKIDNPKIYIDQPVQSNVPADERATFKVRFANESEVDPSILAGYKPNAFTLSLLESSNPNGAKIYLDGKAVVDPVTISVNPGESVYRTLEVERGTAYDYDLIFRYRDDSWSLCDKAKVNVHFLATSTPVHIAAPANRWTMNTLSDRDSTGYFLPVTIDQFDVNYDGFHHIELQYKKHSEGESQWVNLCSFFADDSLYEACTSNRQMIEKGRITNFRFYGEKDPMEMEYDLRAVSFCRLGTGFVTRSSETVQGIKDTRLPAVFGLPQPGSGVLNYDDVITLNFSEDIAYNYLDKTANFSIQGYTNDTKVDYSSWLRLPASQSSATTAVTRDLSTGSFTIDMMANIPAGTKSVQLYNQGNLYNSFENVLHFEYFRTEEKGERLLALVGGQLFMSQRIDNKQLSLAGSMSHIGMSYNCEDSTVHFFVGDNYVSNDSSSIATRAVCTANDFISLGQSGLALGLANVRLWNHCMTDREVAKYRNQRLSGREVGLMAYWPMDETQGNIAHDKANGADLTLEGTEWATREGAALRANLKSVELTHIDYFQSDSADDFTLQFWCRVAAFDGDSVELFRAGRYYPEAAKQNQFVVLYKNDGLYLVSNNEEHLLLSSPASLIANEWTHIAVTVNHTFNTLSAYVNGQVVLSTTSDKVWGIPGTTVLLGSKGADCYFGPLSFWRVPLSSEYISTNYNRQLVGNEMELTIYLPMCADSTRADGVIVQIPCRHNMAFNRRAEKVKRTDDNLMVPYSAVYDKNSHAPVRSAEGLKNLPFSWTATDNALQINIDELDETINNREVHLTVRSVEDLNGNPMKNAKMWTVYVHKNRMEWTESQKEITIPYGEEGYLVAEWENIGGRTMSYNLKCNQKWLSLSTIQGQTSVLSKGKVSLTIRPDLAPGKHVAAISLTDQDGLVSTMYLTVTVVAKEPEDQVIKNLNFSYSMNLMGQVKVLDANHNLSVDVDSRDIVMAFCNGYCVGKAYISVDPVLPTSYVYLTIVGDDNMIKANAPIQFRLWRASTGETTILQASPEITFIKDSYAGCPPSAPVVLTQSLSRIQLIDLQSGWNWISMNVISPTSDIRSLFVDNRVFTTNDRISVSGQGFVSFSSRKVWEGTSLPVSHTQVYQVYALNPATVKILGNEIPDSAMHVTLSRNGWNPLPCLLRQDTPLDMAFTDYQIGSKAPVGTIIKGHDCFAVASEKNGWIGSLTSLIPGQGYYVYHTGVVPCSIRFFNRTTTSAPERRHTAALPSKEATMMPVIASFTPQFPLNENDEVVALVNGNEVARATAIHYLSQPLFFLSVSADELTTVTFEVQQGGVTSYTSSRRITYRSEQVVGTLDEPFLLDADDENGQQLDDSSSFPTYTIDGRLVNQDDSYPFVRVSKSGKTLRVRK